MIEVYDLRQLPENGETVDEPLEKTWLDTELAEGALAEDAPLVALGDGRAKLNIAPIEMENPHGQVVHVSGSAEARLATTCVRCLSDIELAIDTAIEWTLFPEPPKPKVVDEAAAPARPGKKKKQKEKEPEPIELDSPEEATYSDGELDLPGIVREAILLEVAMNPACADEGACAIRTAQLIAAVNPPPEEAPAVDPRWAALEALKAKLS